MSPEVPGVGEWELLICMPQTMSVGQRECGIPRPVGLRKIMAPIRDPETPGPRDDERPRAPGRGVKPRTTHFAQ
jgi:hypothetical protein